MALVKNPLFARYFNRFAARGLAPLPPASAKLAGQAGHKGR